MTLPPFVAIRVATPPQRAAAVAVPAPAIEDGWYDDAESDAAGESGAHLTTTEASHEAFEAAVRDLPLQDLPLYVPDNVDVSRFTPRVNKAIRPEPEPFVAAPEPVLAEPEPVFAAPEPAFAEPEPVVAESEPVVDEPEPEPADVAPDVFEAIAAPHRMTPMRVTPIMPASRRPTPVMGMRTPIRSLTPIEGSPIIGLVPSASNRAVATALEEVAAQVRRGALVVEGVVPGGGDNHSLAAALAAALGALLGVSR
jgi:hypothetical protein